MTLLVIIGCIGLLLLGLPLYIFLFGLSVFLFWQADIPLLSTVVSFQKLQSQEFVYAIPLFTFAGYVLSRSNSPQRIIKLVQTGLYFLPASASIITVVIMALFTALTGASGVTILALGGLLFPLLKKASDNEKFSHGLITGSGSIGLLLAPSLPVIIYAVIANQNVSSANSIDLNKLFTNALIPSLLILGAFIGYSFFKERNKSEIRYNGKEIWEVIKIAKWEIPFPILVYGGIYSGIFTVLEAAIVVTLYTFLVIFVIQRDLSIRKDFVNITKDSLKLSGGIFIIMATAFVLTNYLVYERIPDKIFEWISPYLTNRLTFLIAINVLLLITGCFLDIFSAILIILPLILPVVERYQIDVYHFAIIFLVNLEIGYLTPPVGLNLFISSYSFKKPITYLYRTIVPFLLLLLVILMVVTYVPSMSTWFTKTNEVATESPPNINSMKVETISPTSVALVLTMDKPFQKNHLFKVYYLDEADAEKDILSDFGEVREYKMDMDSLNQPKDLGDGRVRLVFDELFENSDYSVMVEAAITLKESEEGRVVAGLPSNIINFSTSPQ